MPTVTKINREIETISFLAKQRKEELDKLTRKAELTEKERIQVGNETQLLVAVNKLLQWYRKDVDRSLGRLPPQATDLEEAVLGAIMLERPALPAVERFLKPEHFYPEPHQIIYNACKFLFAAGEPVDMRTVVFQLRKAGKIEQIGGAAYIAELTSKVSSAANIEYHARIIIEMAIKRRLILMSGSVLAGAYDDTQDCFELLDAAEEEFKVIQSWGRK